MSDYQEALWMPNNNFFPNTGKKSFVICHGTAGGSSAQGIADYFKSTEGGNEPVSSHYIVGLDGTIVQTINEKDGSYANGVVNNPNWTGNPNYYTISIEHVKASTDNSDALTPAQQSASFALIKDICQRNGIGMHDADANTGITSHASIDPVNRARCPGTFDWNALWSYLANGGNTMTIPTGWTDDGTTLTAPNKIVVVRGFRDFVLNNSWDTSDWPLVPEYAANPVEQSNPSIGAGTAQDFRMSRLGYTATKGVYKTWIGQEMEWYVKQYTALQAEVAVLQALPASANLQQINTLASQIVKLSQVQ